MRDACHVRNDHRKAIYHRASSSRCLWQVDGARTRYAGRPFELRNYLADGSGVSIKLDSHAACPDNASLIERTAPTSTAGRANGISVSAGTGICVDLRHTVWEAEEAGAGLPCDPQPIVLVRAHACNSVDAVACGIVPLCLVHVIDTDPMR